MTTIAHGPRSKEGSRLGVTVDVVIALVAAAAGFFMYALPAI